MKIGENICIEDINVFGSDADLRREDDSSLCGLHPVVVSDFCQLF